MAYRCFVLQQQTDLPKMEPVQPDQHHKHEYPIEYKHERLGRHERSIVAVQVFDDAKYAADPDEDTDNVQREHVSLPSVAGVLGFGCGRLVHFAMEQSTNRHEACKEGDLDEQPGDDDVLSDVEEVGAGGHQSTTYGRFVSNLVGERDIEEIPEAWRNKGPRISRDEDLGQPPTTDDGVGLPVCQQDHSAQSHVHRCRHQSRRNEDQHGLHCVDGHAPTSRFFSCIDESRYVANGLSWIKVLAA